MQKITSGTWYQSSVYNALGQRVQDVTPDGAYVNTLIYPRDLEGHRTGIYNYRPSQNWRGWNEFDARLEDQRVSMGGTSSYLRHSDVTGSTTMGTDQNGAVIWDVNFYPWGRSWKQNGSRYWNVSATWNSRTSTILILPSIALTRRSAGAGSLPTR